MTETILTTKLTKKYKSTLAVNNVTLGVNKGEIYGFLGLNGAGKTTTIRMLLGMIRPTSGACYIDGTKVSYKENKLWESVGYMVEAPASYPELTVQENLELTYRLRQLKDKNAILKIMDQLELTTYKHKKAKHLSLGNGQRLGIAKAILHQPKILILDEPANGLDPAGIVEIRELLQNLANNNGTTIFISSHILSEISKLASKIGIIHNGSLIREVASHELDRLLLKRLLINSRNNRLTKEILAKGNYHSSFTTSGILEINNPKAITHPEKIAEMMVTAGMPPSMLLVEEEDLESFFLRTIGMKGANEQ
ncbi:ABC transporter ATP-binding protein [Bacillus marasmi]|uniref:ABC transporter ATP-binding protein n=1 Tax=Bacillus marasmi TaxID=1926279 RepID=UPI0011CC8F0F|nr:ABC transporter ATP-binding protein [Bacillus marasmi]